MSEVVEMIKLTPSPIQRRAESMAETTMAISAPPFHSKTVPKTPKNPFSSRFMSTPLASPVKKAITGMQGYLEEVGHFTKLDPQEAWLPITESRSGNAYYAAFHTLCSGIGAQALVLPLALTTLGW